MATRRALTGGTGDVNPQFMTLIVSQSGPDTTTSGSFPIPVQRLSDKAGSAQVMELLKIFWSTSNLPGPGAAQTTREQTFSLTTVNGGTAAWIFSSGAVIAQYQKVSIASFTAAGTGSLITEVEPFIHDLTDGSGHGLLVAVDSIFLQVQSINTAQVNTGICKLLYRWKNVPLAEYVGIVQGQQSAS